MVGDAHNGRNAKRHGSDRSSANVSREASTQHKKETMEFTLQVAGKHQSVTCNTIEEHILQDMQTDLKNGSDMAVNPRKNTDAGMLTSEPSQILAEAIKAE